MRPLPLPIAVLLVALTGIAACSKQAPVYPFVEVVAGENGGEVRIPTADVSDGDAHFFTCRLGDKNINFFVRTDADGRLLTHFDACYNCYKYRMGYVQEDRQVVCLACRIAYDLNESEWDWVGPCVPVSLKSRIEEGMLVITARKLESGARLF